MCGMVIVELFFLIKTTIMKKAIVLLAVGFTFTYCNPSQQTGQTTADTTRAATGTGGTGGAGTGGTGTGTGTGSGTDTTARPRTDTTVH